MVVDLRVSDVPVCAKMDTTDRINVYAFVGVNRIDIFVHHIIATTDSQAFTTWLPIAQQTLLSPAYSAHHCLVCVCCHWLFQVHFQDV